MQIKVTYDVRDIPVNVNPEFAALIDNPDNDALSGRLLGIVADELGIDTDDIYEICTDWNTLYLR
jgi:hypothetical protein